MSRAFWADWSLTCSRFPRNRFFWTSVPPGQVKAVDVAMPISSWDALVDFVDGASEAQRSKAEDEARQSTLELASGLAARPIGLPEAIEAFMSARRPFLAEIARIGRRRNLTAAEVSDLYERSAMLLDRLVVIFAAAVAAGSGEG